MSTEQLTNELLALPIAERFDIAQALLRSIGDEAAPAPVDEQAAIADALRRDAELTAGTAVGVPYAEAMESIRRRLGCG